VKGLVHIYTGDGKGKTTASIGLGMRAYGRGFKVLLVQFLKGMETGEMAAINELGSRFTLHRGKGIKKFTWQMNEEEFEQLKDDQRKVFEFASEAVRGGKWDLVILDEVMGAITSKVFALDEVIELVKGKPDALELVLTGRNAPQELIELADYVSEIKAVKHPMEKGIPARKGIEN
jgi:cob(I)alamin adenosyltransferase